MSEVRSAGRVLDLLEYLQSQSSPRSLSHIAMDLLLPKSSTLLLLRTLVDRGYALRDADDRYSLAPHRPAAPHGHAHLAAIAAPEMLACSSLTRETVLLGVMAEGGRVRALAKQVSPQELRYDADLTTLRPSYCTAMGRVILAAMPRAQRQRLLTARKLRAFTPHTITDPAAIERLLQQVTADGYATVEEQYVAGTAGVAAPIRDATGRVIAALDIASVTPRFPATRASLITAALHHAAAISTQLIAAQSSPASTGSA